MIDPITNTSEYNSFSTEPAEAGGLNEVKNMRFSCLGVTVVRPLKIVSIRMKTLLKILIIPLFVISCQNANNRDKNQLIAFDLSELPKTTDIKLSDLGFTDIEYIPMETNDQSFIQGTDDIITGVKIVPCKNYFLTKYWNTILEFKNSGSFATRIGKEGRGPNEYLGVLDVKVDEKNQEIYLLTGWEKKFFVYSAKGEFLRTFNIPFYANEFTFTESGILCYSENHLSNIKDSYTLIDTNGTIIKSFPNRYPSNNHAPYMIWHENLFYRFNNRLFKKEVYSDTIYVYDNMCFKPHLVIDVGEKLITPKVRSEFDGQYIIKNYFDPLKLFEFGNYVYYEFTDGETLMYGFIGSKKNDFQALINLNQGLINDLDGGLNILPQAIKDDNSIIAWVDPLKLKDHVASDIFKNSTPKYPEKKKELKKLANSLKETDNPVLMIVRLKK